MGLEDAGVEARRPGGIRNKVSLPEQQRGFVLYRTDSPAKRAHAFDAAVEDLVERFNIEPFPDFSAK